MLDGKADDYQKTAEYLERIIALMPGHVYWKNREGVLQGCNDEQARSIGLSSRFDIVGLTAYDTLPKDFADEVTRIDREVMETGIAKTVEEVLTLPTGEKSIWLSKKVPLHNGKGEVVGILGISFDITEQRKTEERLLETQHKLEGMTLVAAGIAHEIRTPLATLEMSADTLDDNLPPLIEAYNRASEKLNISELDKHTLEGLRELPTIMRRETRGANMFINMLLMNLNPEINSNLNQTFSMQACVQEALERYPFKPPQRELMIWQNQHDFIVKGKQELVVHILFNLIKNALFYVGKGKIEIKLRPGKPYNQLIFIDTGAGIAPDILPFIFDRFFSRTHNGSGIGLAYCKTVMEALGGNITCESVKESYTKFILSFPAVVD